MMTPVSRSTWKAIAALKEVQQNKFNSFRRQLAQSKPRGMTNTKSQQDCERSRARFEILCAAVSGAGVAKSRRRSELHQIQE